MAEPAAPTTRQWLAAAGIDLALVVLFVVVGRASHHEDGSFVTNTLEVAGPFILALGLGWVVGRAWRTPFAVPTGFVIWLVTVAGGMALRRLVFDRSTAMGFVIVGSIFLLVLPGWRLLWEWWQERHAARM